MITIVASLCILVGTGVFAIILVNFVPRYPRDNGKERPKDGGPA